MMAAAAQPGSFGDLLRQHRLEAGLTQAALAERAELSVRAVQHLERRLGQPQRETTRRLAEALALTGERLARFERAAAPAPRSRAVPGRRTDRSPPASVGTRPHNLPVQPTPLIGREHEARALHGLLTRDDVRLVTLSGAAGTGKTHLSLHVAAEVLDHFADGVFFIVLAPITNPELVPATIAQALEVRDVGGRPVLDSLRDYLRERQILLVLDNFEQILPAAPVVGELLGAGRRLKVLVTSRAPLELRGEHELPVPPLALPDPKRLPGIDSLARYGAVALFVERAAAIRPDFSLTDENASAVAEICVRLDGLPLAIELAAARIRLLGPEAMLARLDRRLPLLTGGARDLPARQRTLRDTITWSYDLLGEGEQRLFRRLSIFVGGWTMEAAEAVCAPAGEAGPDVLDGSGTLVARSLLRREDSPGVDPRFGMLETIREYAAERLEAAGELEALQDRHLDYYLAFAERAAGELTGRRQAEWFDRLERDGENLRAALEWSVAGDQTGPRSGGGAGRAASRVEAGARLADALEFFWVVRGRAREELPRVMALVALAPPRTATRARALTVAAHVHGTMLGDYRAAAPLAEEAVSLWRDLGDARDLAVALSRRAVIAFWTGDYQRAEELHSEARALFRELGGEAGLEVPTALRLAEVAQARGEHERVLELHGEALAESRARGDSHAIAFALRGLARLRRAQGSGDQAVALLRESLALLAPLRDVRCAQLCLEELAGVLCERGRPDEVVGLFAASEALNELMGKPPTRAQLLAHQRGVALVQRRLEPSEFAAARAEGRTMSLEAAIAYALRVTGPS